jgi:hypothetical protein
MSIGGGSIESRGTINTEPMKKRALYPKTIAVSKLTT